MNIEILAPYCTTTKQQKLLERLRKKLSEKNRGDLQMLYELIASLFMCKQYEALLDFLPELLTVPFAENFDIWYPVENSFCLIAAVPTISPEERKACFLHLKSVKDFKSTKGAQEAFDYYFHWYLSLYFVNENLEELEDIDEELPLSQYWIRIYTIVNASTVKLINEEVDYKTLDFPSWMSKPTYNSREELQMRMDALINEQLTALQDKKFVKYY